jgi:hypothetical protein
LKKVYLILKIEGAAPFGNSLNALRKPIDLKESVGEKIQERDEEVEQFKTDLKKKISGTKDKFDFGNAELVEKKDCVHATQKKNILYFAFRDIRERYIIFKFRYQLKDQRVNNIQMRIEKRNKDSNILILPKIKK